MFKNGQKIGIKKKNKIAAEGGEKKIGPFFTYPLFRTPQILVSLTLWAGVSPATSWQDVRALTSQLFSWRPGRTSWQTS